MRRGSTGGLPTFSPLVFCQACYPDSVSMTILSNFCKPCSRMIPSRCIKGLSQITMLTGVEVGIHVDLLAVWSPARLCSLLGLQILPVADERLRLGAQRLTTIRGGASSSIKGGLLLPLGLSSCLQQQHQQTASINTSSLHSTFSPRLFKPRLQKPFKMQYSAIIISLAASLALAIPSQPLAARHSSGGSGSGSGSGSGGSSSYTPCGSSVLLDSQAVCCSGDVAGLVDLTCATGKTALPIPPPVFSFSFPALGSCLRG